MTGKQTVNEFDFFYDGWKLEEKNPNYSRQHSNTDNFFPATRSSQLDGPLLKNMRLTDERMKEDVDNPGQWSEFTFRPNFEGKYGSGAYGHYVTPARAKVVPFDPMTGKQTVNEFDFFYDGWKLEEKNPNYSRQHSNMDNFFPATQSSQLDIPLLKKMGLTDKIMQSEDTLFFALRT